MSLQPRSSRIEIINDWMEYKISNIEFEAELIAEGERRKRNGI